MKVLNKNRLISIFRNLLVTCIMFAAETAGAESTKFYTASELRGSVLTRGPNSAYWSQVKDGARLREGQIIQVTSGSAVTLAEWGGIVGSIDTGTKVKLRISSPMIARLTADLLRGVKVSEYFLEKNYDQGTTAISASAEEFSFSDAWNRISSVVTGRRSTPQQNSLADLEKQGMALSMAANKIKLLSPGMNSVFQSDAWPMEIKLVWVSVPLKDVNYAIYMWPAAEARGQPLAVSRDSFYTVPLQKPGIYMVQVSTLDKFWQSSAHAVHALSPSKELVKSSGGKSTVAPRMSVVSAYPPDRFVVATGDPLKPLVFSWQLNETFRNQKVSLFVRKENGELLKSLSTSLSQAELVLPEGRYVWSLVSEGKERLIDSRSVVVLSPAAGDKTSKNLSVLMQLIGGGQTSTLVLDSGL